MSKKLWRVFSYDGQHEEFIFHCPGCEVGHSFVTKWSPIELGARQPERKDNPPIWTFNGSLEQPTFSPSLLYKRENNGGQLCHLFVENGQIKYLSDCDHKLAGQTVDMENV